MVTRKRAKSTDASNRAGFAFKARLQLATYRGRIYDRELGSGPAPAGFVQSKKFVESHGGKLWNISIYGQEQWAWGARFRLAERARKVRLRRKQPNQCNPTSCRLAIMNLALRGIKTDFGNEHADTFRNVQHPDLRADYLLANPPFNDSDWHRKDDDVRWGFGVPPNGNANFSWVQHFIHHLAPHGMTGFVLANGSMSSNQSGEGEIREAIIEADLVDCMVALPGQLFYSTQIPVCLWFLARDKSGKGAPARRSPQGEVRDRRSETLFIDARRLQLN